MQTCPECVHEIALRQEWSARAQRAEAEVEVERLRAVISALIPYVEKVQDEGPCPNGWMSSGCITAINLAYDAIGSKTRW
jgi:hypothetical protein